MPKAIRPGGGTGDVCNSLLSEHKKEKPQEKRIECEDTSSTSGNGPDTSSFCGRLSKRSLHSVHVVNSDLHGCQLRAGGVSLRNQL